MFTGLVLEVGVVRSVQPRGDGRRVVIHAPSVGGSLRVGDSVAVDGVCLTATERDGEEIALDVIATTLSRTTLDRLQPGSRVNLEPALALGAPLGGHLVQGHVDGTGTVRAVERAGEHVLLSLSLPELVAEVTVLHGSLTVQGVSLTVNALPGPDLAQVALIPYTWDHTNLSDLGVGDPVNLEGDLLGRFVVHYLKRTGRTGV